MSVAAALVMLMIPQSGPRLNTNRAVLAVAGTVKDTVDFATSQYFRAWLPSVHGNQQ